jgi:cyanophycin synthetase
MNVQNAMAAAGAAIAIGASLDDVRHGLRSFETSYFVAPGRLNVTELDGSTIVIDYAHNAPAMRTFGDFVERLAQSQPVDPRRVAVIGTPGDRRRGDVVEYGAVAAHHFDTIVIYEGEYRGRDIGETACAVAEGISASVADGARCSQVEVIIDQRDAAARVLSLLRPGDIGALCMDAADQAWNVVEERRKAVAAGRGGA